MTMCQLSDGGFFKKCAPYDTFYQNPEIQKGSMTHFLAVTSDKNQKKSNQKPKMTQNRRQSGFLAKNGQKKTKKMAKKGQKMAIFDPFFGQNSSPF